jgi:hypothetical protein
MTIRPTRAARRLLTGGTALALLTGLTVGALPTRAADPAPVDPELGPLIAGASSYVEGTHVWTDYAYDDRGPNTDGLDGGDATYPDSAAPGNTADLIQLQLGTGPEGALDVTAVLSTLVEGPGAVIGVGLDTDRDAGTGAASVPGGQWNNSRPLGLEQLVVLSTDGDGRLLSWDGDDWAEGPSVPVTVDHDRNVLSASVPGLAPGAAVWHAVGLVGMADADGSWLDGAHPIYDLAYVRGEDPSMEVVTSLREQVPQLGFVPYQDKIQADILAGNIPPGRAVADVRFGTAETRLAEPVVGLNTFLYHSRVILPEGVQRDGNGQPVQYSGVYQPYAVYLPEAFTAPPPMVVFLHGANQYQNVNPVHFSPTGLVIPGAYDVDGVVIFPNGRTTGWGTPLAHQDALDATDDAIARLGIDPDRVVLSGVSSGGMGTFQLAARYPDRWAGGFSIVGGTQATSPLENLTNVRFRATNGALDPLVNVNTWRAAADALEAAGTVDYRIVLVHNRSHDGPIPEGNCFYLDLLATPRDVDPARVRYTVVPGTFVDRPEQNLHQRPDGAYWVSDLVARDGEERGSIDAESLAKPGRELTAAIDEHHQNLLDTRDFCGPHPTMRNGTSWSTEGRAFSTVEREPANAMTMTLDRLAGARIDVTRAGLSSREPLQLSTRGDGLTRLVLDGEWRGVVRILRDGVEVQRQRAHHGSVVLDMDLVAGGDDDPPVVWTIG